MPDDPTNPAAGGATEGGAGDKTGDKTQAPPDPAAELEVERSRAAAAEARAAKAERELDVARAGLTDPDAADLVEHFYARLPEKDRPSRGDWIRSLTPATAPKGLVPYLPAAPAAEGKPPPAASPAAGKTTVAAAGSPPASAGAAGAATTVTAAEIRQARIQAQRTGDFSKVRELLGRVDPRVKPAKS